MRLIVPSGCEEDDRPPGRRRLRAARRGRGRGGGPGGRGNLPRRRGGERDGLQAYSSTSPISTTSASSPPEAGRRRRRGGGGDGLSISSALPTGRRLSLELAGDPTSGADLPPRHSPPGPRSSPRRASSPSSSRCGSGVGGRSRRIRGAGLRPLQSPAGELVGHRADRRRVGVIAASPAASPGRLGDARPTSRAASSRRAFVGPFDGEDERCSKASVDGAQRGWHPVRRRFVVDRGERLELTSTGWRTQVDHVRRHRGGHRRPLPSCSASRSGRRRVRAGGRLPPGRGIEVIRRGSAGHHPLRRPSLRVSCGP